MRALMSGLRAAEAVGLEFAGRGQALERYAHMQRHAFAAYLAVQRQYYRAERRWPMHSFWQSRFPGAVPISQGV